MTANRSPLSTGNRLYWLLSGGLPLVIFTIVLIVLFTRQQQRTMTRLFDEAVTTAAHVVGRAIGEQIGLLNGLSVDHGLDHADFTAFRLDAQRLWQLHPEWRTIILTDRQQPIFNLRFKPGEAISPLRDRTSLDRVWQTAAAAVGDLAHGYVALRVPVIRDGRMLYTLVAPVDPRYFQDALQKSSIPGHWNYAIVGGDNVVIAASAGTPAAAGEPLPTVYRQPWSDAEDSGGYRWASSLTIGISPWRVLAFAPSEAFEAPFLRTRRMVYLAGGAAAALTIVLVLALSSTWASKREARHLQEEIDRRTAMARVLRESEEKYRRIYENSVVGIFQSLPEGRFISVNPAFAAMLGYDSADDLLTRITDIATQYYVNPDDRQRYRQTLDQQGIVEGFEFEVRRRDGSTIWISNSTRAIRNDTGQVVAYEGVVSDISERKRLEAEQRQWERQRQQVVKAESLNRMAGAIAHRFNNLLGAAIGNIELVLDDRPGDEELSQGLADARQSLREAAEISGLMLTYLGQRMLRQDPLDLSELCRQALPAIAEGMKRSHRLESDLPSSGPIVRANADQLRQALRHLAVNAAEAIGDRPGTIRLTLGTVLRSGIDTTRNCFPIDWTPRERQHACITIADDGSGIAPDDLEKLFDPYFSSKFVGRGLGLSVVLGIMRAHQGAVAVTSQPGKGSTFRLFMPLSDQSLPTRSSAPETAAIAPREGAILLVDDEPQVRNMAQRVLNRLGWTVIPAADGIEALEQFQRHHPAIRVVICDLTMPRMDGWETLAALRERDPQIPFVLTSGYDEGRAIPHRRTLRPQAFLQKPYGKQDLQDVLAMVAVDRPPEPVRGG